MAGRFAPGQPLRKQHTGANRILNEQRSPDRDAVLATIFTMSPEERDTAYLSALYDGDTRRASVIARAPIPKEWPRDVRLLWMDRRGLSGIATRDDK